MPTEPSLGGRERFLSEEIGERGGERREADGHSALECTHAEVLSEGGLADSSLTAEENVLAGGHEVERAVKMLVELAIDRTRMVPVELVEWLGRADRRRLLAPDEIPSVTLTNLGLADRLDQLRGRELALGRVREHHSECLGR